MPVLRNIPIQRKLRLVVLATCSAALVVACGALFSLQFYFFRRDFIRDLSALSEIIGNNSTAALSFQDPQAAQEILGSLRAKPHIAGAALVLAEGLPLAQTGEAFPPEVIERRLPTGFQFVAGQAYFIHPIQLDGEHLGTLLLNTGYHKEARELIRVHVSLLVAVLTISFLVAALISWRLERLILEPLKYLADTVREISRRGDYSVRAEKVVNDELGSFTDSFNGMLRQIQARDQALRHEISERKRAEASLQRMQEQIMEASRQAGMAEVATGVLHNVGNILNSVNVSATLITEKLHRSRIGNLQRVSEFIKARREDLPRFFAEDPKGQVLPQYIIDLSEHLAQERDATLGELELLNKNIEHIKEIVARQQNYARVSALTEVLPIHELVDDAIRMNADAFEMRGIDLEWDCKEIAYANVDRHKVLQILFNLLSNARNAVMDCDAPVKRITARLEIHEETWARLTISDTGVGIAPENLTKIFSHGFTTRKEGHGFGLHTSALAAQQMGGSLSAHSEGVGRGATFVLDLPCAKGASPEILETQVTAV